MAQPSDELIEKILSMLDEKQKSVNRQMEESEKKFFQRAEENRVIQERIEKKFFDRLEENRLLHEKIEKKYFDQLDEKEKQLEEIWQKIFQELEANRIKREELEAAGRLIKRKRKKLQYYTEMAEHPVYSAIIKLFSERGYKIDSDTLKMYWELVTAITRSSARQGD